MFKRGLAKTIECKQYADQLDCWVTHSLGGRGDQGPGQDYFAKVIKYICMEGEGNGRFVESFVSFNSEELGFPLTVGKRAAS